jgi:hypothetical protein
MVAEDPSSWPNPECLWNTADFEPWRLGVSALGWQARADAEGKTLDRVLSGACPRCGHAMTTTVGLAGVLKHEEPGTEYETVRCNCEEPHQYRPDGKRGCGQRGNVAAPVPPKR